MSRDQGSARPPYPPDALGDARLRGRWENDEEILLPMTDDEMREAALWPALPGEVIQPHCMCGAWSSVAECPKCMAERAEWERDNLAAERRARDVAAWRKFKKPDQGDAA